MDTKIFRMSPSNIDLDKLDQASQILKDGGLVAFPTETVYGLGADALNTAAAEKIFAAKGRPSDNPLIVHISDKSFLSRLVLEVPETAYPLMERFWPGPLTLLMKKSSLVSDIITAGLATVGIRMPSHPIALALIAHSGLPIAAPSANTSGKPSPTTAFHVIEDLSGKVDAIIDAGNADVGLESTILDLTVNPPMILRPGGITFEQLKGVLHNVEIDPALLNKETITSTPKAPGMKYRHYSPKADVIVVEGRLEKVVCKINSLKKDSESKGLKVGVLATDQTKDSYGCIDVISMGDRDNPGTIASNLFNDLREFDRRNVQLILAEAIDSEGIGLAVMNRMNKAAGYNIIKA